MELQVGITILAALMSMVTCQNGAKPFPPPLNDQQDQAPADPPQAPADPPQAPADPPQAPPQNPDQPQAPPAAGQIPLKQPTLVQQPSLPPNGAFQPQFPGQGPQQPSLPPNGAFQPQFPGQGPQQPFQAPFGGRFPQGFYPFQQQQGPMPSFQKSFAADQFQQNPFPFQQSVLQQHPNNPFLQSQTQDSAQFSKLLFCQVANGTMPDWTDITCQKYWSCLDFNLSLLTCPADQAYDYSTRECAAIANVKCQQQNLNFWQLLQETVRGGPQPIPSFTPLSSLPGSRQSVALENDVCTKLGENLPRLESVTNSALLNLSNCPFNNCNMTLITFVCP